MNEYGFAGAGVTAAADGQETLFWRRGHDRYCGDEDCDKQQSGPTDAQCFHGSLHRRTRRPSTPEASSEEQTQDQRVDQRRSNINLDEPQIVQDAGDRARVHETVQDSPSSPAQAPNHGLGRRHGPVRCSGSAPASSWCRARPVASSCRGSPPPTASPAPCRCRTDRDPGRSCPGSRCRHPRADTSAYHPMTRRSDRPAARSWTSARVPCRCPDRGR